MFLRNTFWLLLLAVSLMANGAAHSSNYNQEQGTKEVVQASFVPLNATVFQLTQPDGVKRLFVRDVEEPNALSSDYPWGAELDGRRALVMTDSDFKGPQRGYLFIDGLARLSLIDGKEYRIPEGSVAGISATLPGLWPSKGERLKADSAPDIWREAKRLRLWFDNPNKAGVLFAELALAALVLVFIRFWWIKAIGGCIFAASFAGLIFTSSRGAFLALICGLLLIVFSRLKSLLKLRVLVILFASLALAIGGLYISGQTERLGKNLFKEGQRETSRLVIWQAVPRMIVDSPGGWGFGESARAYIDWYQKKNNCLLDNLISGHFTFLVEVGWPLRFVYVSLWILMLSQGIWLSFRGFSPVPVAILCAHAVAACFNPVVSVPELWLMPVAALAVQGSWFWRMSRLTRWLFCGVSCFVALILLSLVVFWGIHTQDELPVWKSGNAVCLKDNNPQIWMADDDYVVHGGYWWMFGKEIRSHFSKKREALPIGYVRDVKHLPDEMKTLVLVGEAARDYLRLEKRPKASNVVFISPPFSWQDVPSELLSSAKVKMLIGSVTTRCLKNLKEMPDWVSIVPGALLYIPNWMDYLK